MGLAAGSRGPARGRASFLKPASTEDGNRGRRTITGLVRRADAAGRRGCPRQIDQNRYLPTVADAALRESLYAQRLTR